VLAVGVTSGRFALSPSASFSVRGERGFFVARNTASFLGATGGRFGINNETTLGGGLFWERVNLSAGLSLTAYSLPLCGVWLCGQVRGVAPGASLRFDLFGPYLSGALGVAVDCAGTWITGNAASIWSGVSVRCSAGPRTHRRATPPSCASARGERRGPARIDAPRPELGLDSRERSRGKKRRGSARRAPREAIFSCRRRS